MASYNQHYSQPGLYADATGRMYPQQHQHQHQQQQQLHHQSAPYSSQPSYPANPHPPHPQPHLRPGALPLSQPQPQAPAQPHAFAGQHYGGGYGADGTSMPPPMQSAVPQPTYHPQLRNPGLHMSPSSPAFQPTQPAFSTPPAASSFYPRATPPIPSPTRSQASTASTPMPAASSTPQPPPPSVTNAVAPSQASPQAQQQQKPILQPPLSPESAAKEALRVTALLDINRVLLQEVLLLQQAGRAGLLQTSGQQSGQQPGQASPTVAEPEGEKKESGGKDGADGTAAEGTPKKPINSREFYECMRRLQANLAYLAIIVDRPHKPLSQIPAYPVIMEPLPPMAGAAISDESIHAIRDLYTRLKELYPDYGRKEPPEQNGSAPPPSQGVTTGAGGGM